MRRALNQRDRELRETHLKYHLLTLDILTSAQTRSYLELRGDVTDEKRRHDASMHAPH